VKGLRGFLWSVGLALGTAAIGASIVDAATAAARWQQGAAQGQQRFVEGVRGTQVDVVGLAIAQEGVLVANFGQAVSSGKWRRNLAAVGTQGWKMATEAKAANYGTGVAAAKDKYQARIAPVLAFEAQLQSQIASMPKGTLADSIARMSAWATGLYNRAQQGW